MTYTNVPSVYMWGQVVDGKLHVALQCKEGEIRKFIYFELIFKYFLKTSKLFLSNNDNSYIIP